MFKITKGKGFHMTFDNGWTISVQWGNGNYVTGAHLMASIGQPEDPSAPDAEVGVWDKDHNWTRLDEHDNVIGYQTPAQVLALMNRVSKFK